MSRPTPEEIEAAQTEGGGWTRAQLAEWGVSWPPPKGWREALREERALNVESEDPDAPKWQTINRVVQRAVRVADFAEALRPHCDSPIEVMLGAHLRRLIAERRAWMEAIPQFRLRRFRYDFALKREGMCEPPRVLIECDGAAFHSTPAQIANDRQKDALAAEIGASMLRFTGKDIVRDPYGCALVAFNEFMQRSR